MKKNKYLMGLLGVFLVSLAAMSALAYQGSKWYGAPNFNCGVHEEVLAAVQDGNYDAWIALREENNLPMHGKMFQVIGEENFALYSEMYEARLNGDFERVSELREELGLGLKQQEKLSRMQQIRNNFQNRLLRN